MVIRELFSRRGTSRLTSMPARRELAETLRRIADGSARDGSLGGRYRPRHTAARSRRASLEALAATLESDNQRLARAGILRVRDLIAAGTGPLWGKDEQALDEAIETTLRVLSPDAGTRAAESHAA